MQTLLIDNYDSYTYNLFQLVARTYGTPPLVLHNDSSRWARLDLGAFDAIVLSPGPGRPQRARDVGVCLDVVRSSDLPVLGVCLGHQAIARLAGADVVPAPAPRHGHLAAIDHVGRDLFAGLPQRFTGVRYHSLCVATPLPDILEPLAWAEDGVLMALRHRTRPWWGVQFHPESVATEHGSRLLENFRSLATARGAGTAREASGTARGAGRARDANGATPSDATPSDATPSDATPSDATPSGAVPGADGCGAVRRDGWSLRWRRLAGAVDGARAFARLFGRSDHAFWLDSSLTAPGGARFSFLGDASGPHGEVLTYRVGSGHVEAHRRGAPAERLAGTIFDVLEDRLRERRAAGAEALPFDFSCGYAGYLGYEAKADCGSPNRHTAATPDAVWVGAGRLVAIDHERDETWLVALCDGGAGNAAEAERWLSTTATTLTDVRGAVRALPRHPAAAALARGRGRAGAGAVAWPDASLEPLLARGHAGYLADVAACQAELRAGESYEICLTNAVDLPFRGDPFACYLRLRERNPAPHAAYLRLGGTAVLCSSPERFLQVRRDGTVRSAPIKGTRPRHRDAAADEALRRELAASPKDHAEHLMIVDLVRNDLGRVCRVGTVTVERFMEVETYATVHQLVSTIAGRLRAGAGPVDAVRACFPGGSMTGAPKLRTMDILQRLETRARGVYSGTIGYLGLGGSADLNIVIRTAVVRDGRLTVGAGGAIVLDSDPAAEYQEMLLKARATLGAVPAAAPRRRVA